MIFPSPPLPFPSIHLQYLQVKAGYLNARVCYTNVLHPHPYSQPPSLTPCLCILPSTPSSCLLPSTSNPSSSPLLTLRPPLHHNPSRLSSTPSPPSIAPLLLLHPSPSPQFLLLLLTFASFPPQPSLIPCCRTHPSNAIGVGGGVSDSRG